MQHTMRPMLTTLMMSPFTRWRSRATAEQRLFPFWLMSKLTAPNELQVRSLISVPGNNCMLHSGAFKPETDENKQAILMHACHCVSCSLSAQQQQM